MDFLLKKLDNYFLELNDLNRQRNVFRLKSTKLKIVIEQELTLLRSGDN